MDMNMSPVLYAEAFAAIPYGIALMSRQHDVLYVNPAGQELLACAENGPVPEGFLQFAQSGNADSCFLEWGEKILEVVRSHLKIAKEDCTLLTIADKTESRNIRREHAMFRFALDNMPDIGIMICDTDGKIILYNKTSAMNDGVPQSSVEGQNLRDFLGGEEIAKNDPLMQVQREQKMQILTHRSTYQVNNKCTTVSHVDFPIMDGNSIMGSCGFNVKVNARNTLPLLDFDYKNRLEKSEPGKGAYYNFQSILGQSANLLNCIEQCRKIARFNSSVLLYGETGTGKELFAQSIHNASKYASEPFIAVNCAAIPETLLESTLFGTKKGAYTSAIDSVGLLEQAKHGTLFLDEVNSMPVGIQSKLLRVLQERKVRRLGSSEETEIHCRIISSTNVPAATCLSNGQFRADFYYRIATVVIEIPPLRTRGDDIKILAKHLLSSYCSLYGNEKKELSPEVIGALMAYNWPGNVRELKHTIENAFISSEDRNTIYLQDLPNFVMSTKPAKVESHRHPVQSDISLKDKVAQFEREEIMFALEQNKWNVSAAARELKCTQPGLVYKIEKYGITMPGQ